MSFPAPGSVSSGVLVPDPETPKGGGRLQTVHHQSYLVLDSPSGRDTQHLTCGKWSTRVVRVH